MTSHQMWPKKIMESLVWKRYNQIKYQSLNYIKVLRFVCHLKLFGNWNWNSLLIRILCELEYCDRQQVQGNEIAHELHTHLILFHILIIYLYSEWLFDMFDNNYCWSIWWCNSRKRHSINIIETPSHIMYNYVESKIMWTQQSIAAAVQFIHSWYKGCSHNPSFCFLFYY